MELKIAMVSFYLGGLGQAPPKSPPPHQYASGPTENLVTPAPPTPEITVSITPDDHLEGPYLLKTRELPGAPPPGPPAPHTGGVQGPAVGPLAGCRSRAHAGGPGGGTPGSSRVFSKI